MLYVATCDREVLQIGYNTNKAIVGHTSPVMCTPIPLSRPIMHFQWGKKTPSQRQAMRPIVNMLEEDRATDIDNIHKNSVKIAHVVPQVSSRTNRHTHRQTYSSQYFATAPVGKVTIMHNNYLPSAFKLNRANICHAFEAEDLRRFQITE